MMPSSRLLELRELAQRDGPASAAAAAVRRELLELHAAGELIGPADRAVAAELLLDGDQDETRIAEQLALSAAARIATARPLAARAFDRLRMQRGQPQKFGTAIVVRDGKPELWPVDPNTTDSERAKWGLPALAVLALRAAAVTP